MKLHSIESMGALDGPGLLTVFFLQGCPLRCLYCHNPDTWDPNGPKEIKVDEIVVKATKYKPYYRRNGGVTFSGGEPLLQAAELRDAMEAIHENGIHTALDTSGVTVASDDLIREILYFTDLVILDIKHEDPDMYKMLTGRSMDNYLRFKRLLLESGCKIWLRHVVVPAITDSVEHLQNLMREVESFPQDRVEKFELLPYHSMGKAKYEELGIDYVLKDTPDLSMAALQELKAKAGIHY